MRYESARYALNRGDVLRRTLRPIGRRLLVAGSVLSIILVGTILLFELLSGMPLHWIEALRMPFFIFGLFGLMFGLMVYFTWQNHRLPKNAALFEERWVVIDEEAFEVHTSNGIFSRVPWTAVVAAKHDAQTTLLNVSAAQAFAIPDGVLAPEGQAALLDRVDRLPG